MQMKVELKELKKSFGEKEVLKGISLETESGQALGLLGRNGAGKTTTIRILMGVFYQDGGTITVDGKPIDRSKLRIGYLPEERGLYPKQKIGSQLVYFGMLRGLSKQQARDNTVRWLDRMGMSEYKDRKLETLSKGNQQKIQLAVTLLCDPQLVILDEPFSGLDPVNAMLLKDVIAERINDGAAVIFSSHQMNYIEEFCNNISILNGGRIVIDGNINNIKRSYPRDTINVFSEDPETVIGVLKSGFADRMENAAVDEKNACVTVKLRDEGHKDSLVKMLLDSRVKLDGFRIKEPSLNDIFVQYTEGGI